MFVNIAMECVVRVGMGLARVVAIPGMKQTTTYLLYYVWKAPRTSIHRPGVRVESSQYVNSPAWSWYRLSYRLSSGLVWLWGSGTDNIGCKLNI